MPTVDIYSKQQVDALIAGAGGLPDPTSASAGDVLTLDSNKDPAWAAVPDELPATTSASAGDVLTLDSNKDPAWVAPSGGGIEYIGEYGGTSQSTANKTACFNAIEGLPDDHIYLIVNTPNDSTLIEQFVMSKIRYFTSGSVHEYLCLGGSKFFSGMDVTRVYIHSRVECNNNVAKIYNGWITGTTIAASAGYDLYNIKIYRIA